MLEAAVCDFKGFASKLVELFTEINVVGYQKTYLSDYNQKVGK